MTQALPAAEWFANESFWAAFRPLAFGPARWSRATCEAEDILRLLNCGTPKPRILDLCCGPGRYALEFAARGADVTAVDLSESYLAELKSRGEAAALTGNLEIVRSDMRQFRRAELFDGAICVGLSFGYLASDDEDMAVLQNLHHSLRVGGRLILEVPTPTWPDELGPWFVVNAGDRGAFVEQDVPLHRRRVNSRWRFEHDLDSATYSFSQRLFTPSEVTDDLSRAGFDEVRLLASYDGSPIGSASRRIIAVARKSRSLRAISTNLEGG